MKPCPFCGCTLEPTVNVHNQHASLRCTLCNATGPTLDITARSDYPKIREELTTLWNDRRPNDK